MPGMMGHTTTQQNAIYTAWYSSPANCALTSISRGFPPHSSVYGGEEGASAVVFDALGVRKREGGSTYRSNLNLPTLLARGQHSREQGHGGSKSVHVARIVLQSSRTRRTRFCAAAGGRHFVPAVTTARPRVSCQAQFASPHGGSKCLVAADSEDARSTT